MVICFQKMKTIREQRKAYKDELVARIVGYYKAENKGSRGHDDFYLEHVKSGFPVHILEGIASRLGVVGA